MLESNISQFTKLEGNLVMLILVKN